MNLTRAYEAALRAYRQKAISYVELMLQLENIYRAESLGIKS